MAKKKWNTVGPKRGVGGKTVGTVVVNKETGEQKTLLTPHGKYAKFSKELELNQHLTNDGQKKTVRGRNTLSKAEKAYRSGYIACIIEQTKAYNSQHDGNDAQNGGAGNVKF